MAIYTTTDRDAVKAALIKLATGQQAVTVSFRDRTVTYQATQIGEVRALLAEIIADLKSSTKGARRVALLTDKGL